MKFTKTPSFFWHAYLWCVHLISWEGMDRFYYAIEKKYTIWGLKTHASFPYSAPTFLWFFFLLLFLGSAALIAIAISDYSDYRREQKKLKKEE